MTVHGSCHCGKTKFELTHPPAETTACTCSYCAKSGALWAYYPPEAFRLLTAEGDRGLYLWNSRMVEHYFCPGCGMTTYGVSPVFVPEAGPGEEEADRGECAAAGRCRYRGDPGDGDRREESVVGTASL